jgi:hypothetical protein
VPRSLNAGSPLSRLLLVVRSDHERIVRLRLLQLQCLLERAVQPHIHIFGGHQQDRHGLVMDRLSASPYSSRLRFFSAMRASSAAAAGFKKLLYFFGFHILLRVVSDEPL